MTYVLAVLSHGNPSPTVDRTLASFREHVTPEPVATVHYHDGPGGQSPIQLGFCRATAKLWGFATTMADEIGAAHVFWLEHDFVFERPVDLGLLAAVLRPNPDIGPVAQVQLMRQPVNAAEMRAGGLVESRPGEYTRRRLVTQETPVQHAGEVFLTHRSYFTTNPSLMSADFMAKHPFAPGTSRLPYDIECEGHYGQQLIRDGYVFAVMGEGEPWVTHIGERTGHGY